MNGTPDCPVTVHEYQISQQVSTGRTEIHSRTHLTHVRRLSRKLRGMNYFFYKYPPLHPSHIKLHENPNNG